MYNSESSICGELFNLRNLTEHDNDVRLFKKLELDDNDRSIVINVLLRSIYKLY